MSTSRKAARDALVALLETALIGDGLPVKTVSGSKPHSLEGITPAVFVLSRGSQRNALTFAGNRALFSFAVQVWVLETMEGSWTRAQAEDALDAIEALIAGVVETYRANTNWDLLEYDEGSSIIEVSVAGVPYFWESIPVNVLLGRS